MYLYLLTFEPYSDPTPSLEESNLKVADESLDRFFGVRF